MNANPRMSVREPEAEVEVIVRNNGKAGRKKVTAKVGGKPVVTEAVEITSADDRKRAAKVLKEKLPAVEEAEIERELEEAAAEDEAPPKSQATIIVLLVQESGVDLWHTAGGDCYATVAVNGHREHYPVKSKAFRQYVTGVYLGKTDKAPGGQGLSDAINTLEALARFRGERKEVFTRVGRHEGDI